MLIYIKIFVLVLILSLTGVFLIKRFLSTKRAEIILPTGTIFGIALFLFLVNLLAYVVKKDPLFYTATITQLLLTITVIKLIKSDALEFPRGKHKLIWIISLLFWGGFLMIITNTSPFDGSDNVFYHSQASVFSRGDFPIHTPWQPDYISYSHLGISQLLGAFRSLTGASYHFIHALLAIITLFCSVQILTWLLAFKMSQKISDILVFSFPSLIGFISLGAFMLTWPNKLALPILDHGILAWLNKLPTIEISNASAGFLDPLIYILHRLVSTSIFLSILPLLLYPSRYLFTIFALIISCASIALLDESVLFVTLPAIFLVSLFSFEKKIKTWVLAILAIIVVVVLQGGIVTESVLNRYNSGSGILIFPPDNPDNPYQDFRSFRLKSQSSTLFDDLPKFQPFRWLQIGILWQLLTLFCMTSYCLIRKKSSDFKIILIITFISSLSALVAFHALVPKLFHTNGWRFLALSYQLSGIGIAFFLIDFLKTSKHILLKFLFFWILICSLVPPFARLFPRRDDLQWFKAKAEPKRATFEWVKKNLPVEERIIVLTDSNAIPSSNIELTTSIGAFTPVWSAEIRAYENFDTSPSYADLYYTLNPDPLKILGAKYFIISNIYINQLPKERKQDLLNSQYFKQIFWDTDRLEGIFILFDDYLKSAKILDGTLSELSEIAPKNKTYYLDYESLQNNKNLYKATAMALGERKIYGVHDYWSRIEGKIPIFGQLENYDYLVLGSEIDPYIFCKCNTKLIWSGYQGRINLWKIH